MDGPKLAVIGLGLMGSRMARRLAGRGFALRGFDPDPDRMAEFATLGGVPTHSPSDAVAGCEAAILSLPNSEISKEVCLGAGGLSSSGMKGLTVYDTTTGRPQDAVDMASQLEPHRITYCDTTLSGNGEIAERGQLVVMMGGPEDAYSRGISIFEAIGRSHHHLGQVGAGARMKLLVNQTLNVHRMALAETLVVAEMAGLDLDSTLDVLEDSLAYSKAMEVWGTRMVTGEHAHPFSRIRQSRKDARLIVEHGEELGAPLDLVSAVADALAEGERTGLGELDNSAIIEVIRRRAGIGRVP